MSQITLPDDIIINIFKYTDAKLNMIEIFPWLTKVVSLCESCKFREACFIIEFDYYNAYCIDNEIVYYRNRKIRDDINLYHYFDKPRHTCSLDCYEMLLQFNASYQLNDFKIDKNHKLECNYTIKNGHFECKNTYKIKAFGIQLRALHTKEQIQKFIRQIVIKDKERKILKSDMIKYYKPWFPRINTEKEYTDVKLIFDGELIHDEKYYLGYQFKSEDQWKIINSFKNMGYESD